MNTGFCISQIIHKNKLKLLLASYKEHDALRSIRVQPLYIAHTTCPNARYKVLQIFQVKHKPALRQHIKPIRKAFQSFKNAMNIKTTISHDRGKVSQIIAFC